jgi:hypothetical protein
VLDVADDVRADTRVAAPPVQAPVFVSSVGVMPLRSWRDGIDGVAE